LAEQYKAPDWFRDAKLGIWAHWGPQCIPEAGDWYARRMYMQGSATYDHHVRTYGHPSRFGFMEFLKDWRIDGWDPDRLMGLYKAAGARYFVALAGHHDNFDMFASQHQPWNVTRVGPKVDTMAGWAKAARTAGLRFGVSNHLAHNWHWFQTAYGYDPEGAFSGLRYDAARLNAADGKGQWWEGLDPKDLYGGPHGAMVPPAGLSSIKDMDAYNEAHSGQWPETPPPGDPAYVRRWLARSNELIERYQPDLVYYDDYQLPLGQAGLDATDYFYRRNKAWHGRMEGVATGKQLNDLQRRAIMEDVERGFSDHLRAEPWQTDTCIGDWHYDRDLYRRGGYKSALQVIQRLSDVVAKNGNLLLSIPVRANGSIDEKEERILSDMAAWMAVNGDAIFGTRPWVTYGEGPFHASEGLMTEGKQKDFSAEDIRFTTGKGHLYALIQAWPDNNSVKLRSMANGAAGRKGTVERIELLGRSEPLSFSRQSDGLVINLPGERPAATPVLRLSGNGLV
jgi:alpha-L-fucosidase